MPVKTFDDSGWRSSERKQFRKDGEFLAPLGEKERRLDLAPLDLAESFADAPNMDLTSPPIYLILSL